MYAKLVFKNAKRSLKDYLIYLVTLTLCISMFYSLLSVTSDYYRPDLGLEYDLQMLSGGVKLAICVISLLLLFLISYVNHYMILRRQKEFAVQTVIGMERRTTALLFFFETLIMGTFSILLGVLLGSVFSQFITAMLLNSFGKPFTLSWMLFPDTVLLTCGVFLFIFLVIGAWNIRFIRKIKVIDMLYAEQKNEPTLSKDLGIRILIAAYALLSVYTCIFGIRHLLYFFDPRFPLPAHLLYWGTILLPAASVAAILLRLFLRKWFSVSRLIAVLFPISLTRIFCFSLAPVLTQKYFLPFDASTLNLYMGLLILELIFAVFCLFFLLGSFLLWIKQRFPHIRYRETNLFFFGQVLSKLKTTSKTMALICLTLTFSLCLFLTEPFLCGWANGYLKERSVFDIQITSQYQDTVDESQLVLSDYAQIDDYLSEHQVAVKADCLISLYLPKREQFHQRVKQDFPVVAVSLSDYNRLAEMLGYEPISLQENEFAINCQSIALDSEVEDWVSQHHKLDTDAGLLTLKQNGICQNSIGESIYNIYTNLLLIFPDHICEQLLPVMNHRYLMTEEPLPFSVAVGLEKMFDKYFPEEPQDSIGMRFFIRTATRQVNDNIANTFILKASMIYSALVLLVSCFTVLSLQQLFDAPQYHYRFSVLHKMGIDEAQGNRLIGKQLLLWFGVPVFTALLLSFIFFISLTQSFPAEIQAYIGYSPLIFSAICVTLIFFLLFACYFVTTWLLFKKSALSK